MTNEVFSLIIQMIHVTTTVDITPLPLCCFINLHLLFNRNLEYSEAKCLGAKTVCRKAFQYSQSTEQAIISELVTDQQALHAVEKFLGK